MKQATKTTSAVTTTAIAGGPRRPTKNPLDPELLVIRSSGLLWLPAPCHEDGTPWYHVETKQAVTPKSNGTRDGLRGETPMVTESS